MPIIVDEVVITVEVSNQASGGAASKPSDSEDKQQLIEQCVEQVLEILEQRHER
ncbi:DUF5908 family protein [Gynuella sp.]|uniref:DUF5908 family protein n=1 Tax=Gynuella sp. TaxID=2969146 RepID=UPI003D0D75C6